MNTIDALVETCNSLLDIVDGADQIEKTSSFEEQMFNLQELLQEVTDDKDTSRLEKLADCLENISSEEHHELYDSNTLFILSKLIKNLADSMDSEDWESELGNLNDYELYDVNDKKDVVNAIYLSQDDQSNRMIMLNFSNKNEICDFINNHTMPGTFLTAFMYYLKANCSYEKILFGPSGILPDEIESRIGFIRMNAVLHGEVLFLPQEYQAAPITISIRYDNQIKYAQFADIVAVMNEYNVHQNILDKYLRIYQVIENYMYKFQICKLCDRVGYSKIRVRDFKAISEELSKNELHALKELLKIAGHEVVDGVALQDKIAAEWDLTVVNNTALKNHVDDLIQRLGIDQKSGCPVVSANNHENIMIFCAKLIYAIRCSIVHNKVNEYHITYTELEQNTKQILENFLMPNMEYIVYGLMLNNNDLVMYKSRELKLY